MLIEYKLYAVVTLEFSGGKKKILSVINDLMLHPMLHHEKFLEVSTGIVIVIGNWASEYDTQPRI